MGNGDAVSSPSSLSRAAHSLEQQAHHRQADAAARLLAGGGAPHEPLGDGLPLPGGHTGEREGHPDAVEPILHSQGLEGVPRVLGTEDRMTRTREPDR